MLGPILNLVSWIFILVLSGFAPSWQVSVQTKAGCKSRCGKLYIPYPFGTKDGGSGCYYDGRQSNSFLISCDESTDPPVPYWYDKSSNIPVDAISFEEHEIHIRSNVAYDCYSSSGNRTSSFSSQATLATFKLSGTKNSFVAVGCDTFAYLSVEGGGNNAFTGCRPTCTSTNDVTNGTCLGAGCCETSSFPENMQAFNITLSSYNNHTLVHDFNPCSFAFVTAKDYFKFSTASLMNITEKMMPTILDWSILGQTCDEAQMNKTSYMCKVNTNCTDVETLSEEKGYRCHCKDGYDGNPYLSGSLGCQDKNECRQSSPCHKTALCENLPGSYRCYCHKGYDGNAYNKTGDGCIHQRKYNPLVVGLGVGMGCLVLLLCASWLALGLRQRISKKEREKFFKDNGGLVLQRLLSQHQSYVERLRVFTAEELIRATDNYNENRIIGKGGQGTVYKATVMNDREVAIKKARLPDRGQVNVFIQEVIVLSQINHKNVVKLIGCCLETELPLLVYEFLANGTVSDHLHDGDGRGSNSLISWGARLRIAAETAGALSYLHSGTTVPIVHRDVKSTNILLDENFTAKVSDFGASKLMPLDKAQLSTLVQGTFGYLDPEYFHSSQLTEKSDVYSFGVVLAELLTGMMAISFDKPEKERTLSLCFVSAVKEGRCLEIIDKRIINEGNAQHITEVAMLASRCLKIRGEDRPSMKEVALELEGLLRATEQHPWMHHPDSIDEAEYLLAQTHVDFSATDLIDTTTSEDTIRNQLIAFNIENAR